MSSPHHNEEDPYEEEDPVEDEEEEPVEDEEEEPVEDEEEEPVEEEEIGKDEERLAPPKFNDRQVKDMLGDYVEGLKEEFMKQRKKAEEDIVSLKVEIVKLKDEVGNQRVANVVLTAQKEALIKERDQYQKDFTAMLQRVGSAGPEAYFTREDIEYLADQRRVKDMDKILKLENERLAEATNVTKLMMDMGEWQGRAHNANRAVQAAHIELELKQRETMQLKTANAKLMKENTEGMKNMEEKVRTLLRELEEIKGASPSSPPAKRPRTE